MSAAVAAAFRPAARFDGVRPINIYLLRLLYGLMFFVLGRTSWSEILTHQGAWEALDAMAWTVWTAFATLAGLGILRPLKMLPIILLEGFYKVLWLAMVAYPLSSVGELAGSAVEGMANAFIWVILAIIATPWAHVLREYLTWPKRQAAHDA